MAYIVAEPCVGTKDRACVEVCPVDCFYDYPDAELNKKVGRDAPKESDAGMLVIHPDQCIHCGACEPECPTEAIFEDDDVPEQWSEYVELNANICEGYSDEELDQKRVTSKD